MATHRPRVETELSRRCRGSRRRRTSGAHTSTAPFRRSCGAEGCSATSHRIRGAWSAGPRSVAPGETVFRRMGFTPWDKKPERLHPLPQFARGLRRDGRRGRDLLPVRRRPPAERTRAPDGFDGARQGDAALLHGRERRAAGERAILDKFVGDEVVGFFMPFMTGPDHAGAAVLAARELLLTLGHGDAGGPAWASTPSSGAASASKGIRSRQPCSRSPRRPDAAPRRGAGTARGSRRARSPVVRAGSTRTVVDRS